MSISPHLKDRSGSSVVIEHQHHDPSSPERGHSSRGNDPTGSIVCLNA